MQKSNAPHTMLSLPQQVQGRANISPYMPSASVFDCTNPTSRAALTTRAAVEPAKVVLSLDRMGFTCKTYENEIPAVLKVSSRPTVHERKDRHCPTKAGKVLILMTCPNKSLSADIITSYAPNSLSRAKTSGGFTNVSPSYLNVQNQNHSKCSGGKITCCQCMQHGFTSMLTKHHIVMLPMHATSGASVYMWAQADMLTSQSLHSQQQH